jgi:hypothetical protein
MLQRIGRKPAKEGTTVAAISEVQWARIYACIWSDPTLQQAFEVDPKKAIFPLRTTFQIDPNDTLMDLSYNYDPVWKLLKDPARTDTELKEVITSGKLNGKEVRLSASVFTTPDGSSIPLPQDADPNAISIANWTRIYAYIAYQETINGNPYCRALFESDPAKCTQLIVTDLKKPPYSVTITYTKLLNLGAPPNIPLPDTLKAIRNGADIKNSRYMPNFCT